MLQIKDADDGLCCHNPKVLAGQQAMARKRRGWDDWLIIGEAIQEGQTISMHKAGTNKREGKAYEKAMSEWLVANEFKEIDAAVRSRLHECLKHRDEIEKWRSTLTDNQRFAFNHPDSILRRWKKATVVAKPQPKKESPFAKLKTEVATLEQEKLDLQEKLERARTSDLWGKDVDEIAAEILVGLTPDTAKLVANAILSRLTPPKGKK